MGIIKLVSILQAAWGRKHKVTIAFKIRYYTLFFWMVTSSVISITSAPSLTSWSNGCCLCPRSSPCNIEWPAETLFMSGQYSQVRGRDHVCVFTPMCPCREIWSRRQHPVHEGRLLCAALCFQPVHERNCNYGTQPPPLTHANMHYNWAIHTGKCLLNGLPIFQPAANHYRIFS